MAATEVEIKWQGIFLHDAYHLWTKQKRAYLSELSQQTGNSTWYRADEEFALHILAVHAKFCTELCGGRAGILSSSSRPQPSPDPHNAAHAASSRSACETESATSTEATVVKTETTDVDLALASGTTAHEHHDKAVTVAIGAEDVSCQDASSDVTENVPGEESQVTAEECSTGMKIKTEPEDAYELVPMGIECCPVTSDLPGVSCDQQTKLMTDMIHKVKYDDGHFEDDTDLRPGRPTSTAQRIDAMRSPAETQDNNPPTTTLVPSTSSDVTKKAYKCHVCHKILRKNGRLQRTSTNKEDSPALCNVCQKDGDHTDEITDLLEDGTQTKNPVEGKEIHHSPTGMSTTDLQRGKFSGITSYYRQSVCQSMNSKGSNLHGHVNTCEKTAEFKLYSKAYGQKSDLDTLLKIQTGEKTLKCTVRSQLFHRKDQMESHIKAHPVETPAIKCEPFPSVFSLPGTLHRHMKMHTSCIPHECSFCSKAFCSKGNLDVHMRTHTGEKPHTCNICSKAFCQMVHLNDHMKFHTGEKSHQCSLCSRAFFQKRNLNRHMRTHSGEKPHKCDMCSKAFFQKRDLNCHMKTHSGEKPHQCSLCSRAFFQKRNLNRHTRTHSGEKPHKCDMCSKAFFQKRDLNCHMKTHSGEKPHNCDMCSKAFSLKKHLNYHMKTHSDEIPHKCDMCSKAFSQKKHLNYHMKTHSGEKPYKCDMCSKAFYYNSHLIDHMKTHYGEKPHKCSLCSKAFSKKSHLNRHMKTHSGEKPYKCDMCSKALYYNSHLIDHMKTHSGEKPHICSLCSKAFSKKSHLNRHMRTHSGEKPHKM